MAYQLSVGRISCFPVTERYRTIHVLSVSSLLTLDTSVSRTNKCKSERYIGRILKLVSWKHTVWHEISATVTCSFA